MNVLRSKETAPKAPARYVPPRKKRQPARPDIQPPLTPMIDVTFQLILFFILVGQVASDALARMILPEPYVSQAQLPEGLPRRDRMTVNIVSASKSETDLPLHADPDARKIGFYQVDAENVGSGARGLGKVEDLIARRLAALSPDARKSFYIEVRADKRLPFAAVYPVLRMAGQKGVSLMNITAIRELAGGE